MGILHRNRNATLVAVIAMSIIGSTASAFDTTTSTSQAITWGTCTINFAVGRQGSQVWIHTSSAYETAGGSYYLASAPYPAFSGDPPITVALLQSCDAATSITSLQQNGADYATADLDNSIGFSFRATDPAGGLVYDHEFAVSGLTGNQVVITKVRYVPPAPVAPTSPDEALIAGLQSARMNQPITNQPDLTHFLDGKDGPQVSMSALDGTRDIGARFIAGPFWGQVTAS